MKLSEWARKEGIHARTAERWFARGTLPAGVSGEKLATGTIIITDTRKDAVIKEFSNAVTIYARVSTSSQKEDLQRQVQRLQDFCAARGFTIANIVTEIASGMNDNRPKLSKLLADSAVQHIVVEHRDRLTRFGFNMVKQCLQADNRSVTILDETEFKNDIMQDFIDIMSSFCSRIYGKRAASNKAKELNNVLSSQN